MINNEKTRKSKRNKKKSVGSSFYDNDDYVNSSHDDVMIEIKSHESINLYNYRFKRT